MLRKVILIGLLAVLAGYALYNQFWKEEKQEVVQQPQVEEALANQGLEIGKEAPDFELHALDGSKVKLSDLKGKKVILNFWATWCPPCRQEVPEMQTFYEKHKEDVVILAVNATALSTGETKEKVKSFASQYGVTFPILFDSTSEVSDTYRIMVLPTSYFVDTKGVIRQKSIGAMTGEYMEKTIQALQ
ncbi:redoxin domain-containing protein [Ectobacillus funiculus]|jgi:peroxiredoxin|uniref:redoxin domain-containing protein n=1 Tax=Ectobacillus funiculus TaxID=137993 RepID=UPI00101BB56D|nr:redoxin domain-containing protein [Ectobacillus funiculus]